jgi:hypothetical protein
MKEKTVKIARLSLAIVAMASIALGFLKIYSHYYSIYRFDPIDYIIAIGAIVGGLLVITQKFSDLISVVCISFFTFEVIKALIDYRDINDVLLCVIASFCLIIPIFRYSKIESN